ncbi:MAG: aldehyde dehydrogenase family protein [Bacteriovoracia bacterium]
MLKIINPATEEVIKEVDEDNVTSIQEKFKKAKLAQIEWSKRSIESRINILKTFRNLLVERRVALAETLTLEVGKPITQSNNELKGVLDRIDFLTSSAAKTVETEIVFNENGMLEQISHEPLGVIANISAWNYPYLVGANVFVPALITGNAVLYKPSEFSTLTGLEIARALHDAGVPKDVFMVLVGSGVVGSELLKLPIQGVFFTGSYATGKKINEAVASKLIKVQLELGGKDPTYVCDDVNVEIAATSTADGAFYNNGQSCCSVERIYVHEKIYDKFVDCFVKEVKGFVVGAPTDPKTYIGSLARPAQIEVLEKQVLDAKAKGAILHCGGKRREGRGAYFEPTVFSNVDHSMLVMRDESFGPIIGIQKVTSDDEAIKLMNDTQYGLTAGIYTLNETRAKSILEKINSGTVYWNCCDRVSPRLPWSGRGHSGIGLTLSTYGIKTFTQPKGWHLKSG